MTVVADSSYINGDISKLKKNTYNQRDKDFSGIVIYSTPKGEFVSGWIYEYGNLLRKMNRQKKVDQNSTSSRKKVQSVKNNLVESCTAYDVYQVWCEWGGTPENPYEIFKGCTTDYVRSYTECILIDQGDVTITNPGAGSGGSGSGSGGSVGTSPDPSPCVPVNVSTTKGGKKVNLVRPPDDGFPNPTDPAPCPTAPTKPTKNYGMDKDCLNCRITFANFEELIKDLQKGGYQVFEPFETVLTDEGIDYIGKVVEIKDSNGKLVASYFTPSFDYARLKTGIYYSAGDKGPKGNNSSSNGNNISTGSNGLLILPSIPAPNLSNGMITYINLGNPNGNSSLRPPLNPSFGYPINVNIPDVGTFTINNILFDLDALPISTASKTVVNSNMTAYTFDNNLPAESYPVDHPVSQAIINYNIYIYNAFKASNNTSVRNFHQTSKGLNGTDGYGKAMGAIGEGLIAQRLLSIPSLTLAEAHAGAKVEDNRSPGKIIFIDLLTVQNLPEAEDGYSYINLIYTDLNGNATSKRLRLQRNSSSRVNGTTLINKGVVAYEVKTYNPSNTSEVLFKSFVEGIQQTIHRAFLRNVTAGVLVFDKDSFQKLYNSPYKSRVDAILYKTQGMKNINNEQAVFIRLEKNLWSESNKAYHALIDKVKIL